MLDNPIMKGISHKRQINICLIFPPHIFICGIMNLSNTTQWKQTKQEMAVYKSNAKSKENLKHFIFPADNGW